MRPVNYLGGLLCGILLTTLAGCGVAGPPQPPSLALPRPVPDLHAVRKGDRVYLAWTVPAETTDSLPTRHLGPTRVCQSRDVPMKDCANPVGEVPPPAGPRPGKSAKIVTKAQATYTDQLTGAVLSQDLRAELFYAVSVLNEEGRAAGISNVVSVPAIVAPPPPSDFQAQVTAAGVVLSWSGIPPVVHSPQAQYIYRLYRREAGSQADTLLAETPLDSSQFIDHSFYWEKTYSYRSTVVTKIRLEGQPETQFEGDDTPVVKVFVHDIFPPAVPTGLQAVFSGVGQQPFIDMIWAPDTEADLAGYNIYRREAGGEPKKMNTEPVRVPAFRDTSVSSGHTYFYSVSAVDVRGNESGRSVEAGESVP